MIRLMIRWVFLALGVFLAAESSAGIHYEDSQSLLFVVIVLSILNLFLKPLLIVFALPFVVLTLGLGILLINAVLVMLAGELVPGFEVVSIWAALWAALVISVTSLVANVLLTGKWQSTVQRRGVPRGQAGRVRDADDDAIDV